MCDFSLSTSVRTLSEAVFLETHTEYGESVVKSLMQLSNLSCITTCYKCAYEPSTKRLCLLLPNKLEDNLQCSVLLSAEGETRWKHYSTDSSSVLMSCCSWGPISVRLRAVWFMSAERTSSERSASRRQSSLCCTAAYNRGDMQISAYPML
jgi:hypothetical protein